MGYQQDNQLTIPFLHAIAGQYTVVVSTFEPNQIGKYKLTLQSHADLSLTRIPIEGAVSIFFISCRTHTLMQFVGSGKVLTKYHYLLCVHVNA